MRVTTVQMYDNLLNGIQKQASLQAKGNAQISSGTRYQRPSEAGMDYKTSLDIRQAQSAIIGSLDAIGVANSRLEISQSMLSDMNNILVRAQSLAVQLSSGQNGPQEMRSGAVEVTQLLERFMNNGNQSWQGQSLFAGTAVDQDAFVIDGSGSYIYNGSDRDRVVVISDRQQVVSNVRGDSPAFTASLNALKDFETALQANDVAGIQTALGSMISSGEQIISLNAETGSRIRALDSYKTSYGDLQYTLDRQMNELEGVDIPAVVAQMQQASIALQASYSQIASLRSLSLVNYLS